MATTIDSVGRIVVPQPLREALGLRPGSTVDISRYGAGLQLVATGRTAQLVEEDGVLVDTRVAIPLLATRDARAQGTYEAVGVEVLIAG